jgi:hypothetical protein
MAAPLVHCCEIYKLNFIGDREELEEGEPAFATFQFQPTSTAEKVLFGT